ncbi:MAG TPA: type VI secretion system accessory protein TagJ [Stellaceae bacterium]|jgi:type VI secretion system protein ImpE|nr:type VI secretion system accessory protein TagJ [Stellaceae bacterium]
MDALEALRRNDPEGALAALLNQVRGDPANAKLRVFLFQLCCIMGDWARAKTQLDVATGMDDGALLMSRIYGDALTCEAERQKVFAGDAFPTIFGDPEPWMAELYEALRLDRRGEHAAAADLRDRALDAAPTSSGRIDGKDFAWIADADARLGPLLEAIINGRYFWLPFIRIARITIEPPSDLRDQVWMPVKFVLANGGETVGLIPTRYPESEQSTDPLVRLARKTAWMEMGEGTQYGSGQRMLATDIDDFPLMDVRTIEIEESGAAAGTANG